MSKTIISTTNNDDRGYTYSMEIPKIILFGDSITQGSFDPEKKGFGCYVTHRFARRADVVNRGFSGYTTRWAVPALPHVFVKSDRVKLVTIFFGANDSCIKELNPRHHVPLHLYGQNIEAIINFLNNMYGDELKIILIAPPPIDVDARLRFQIERYGKEGATGIAQRRNPVTKLYRDIVISIGKKYKIPVLDLFQLFLNEPNWKTFLNDGLHFSTEGNEFVGKKLLQCIDDHLHELVVKPCNFTTSFANSGSNCSGMKHLLPWHDKVVDDSFEYLNLKRQKTMERADL